MVKGEHPSVFVVDSHATRPPLPPRMGQRKQHMGPVKTLLIVLVSIALCGLAIEACFIYRLFQLESIAQALSSKHTTGEEDAIPTMWSSHDIAPSKPVAHLTDGHDVVHKQQVMSWSMIAEPLLYEIDYKDGSLIIQKQGYYYVYSKVFFTDSGTFHHTIKRNTDRYSGGSITLLQSRKYSVSQKLRIARSNSYLGGVFYLGKNDAVYVTVNNTTKINRHGPYENIFGAYMI